MSEPVTTSWLDDDETEAWLALVSILEVLPATLDAQLLRDADLTFFEYLVLVQISEAGADSMRLSDLASATHTTLPRLSRVVARLESDGLLVRRVGAGDARSRHANLTEAGRERLAAAAPGHLELVQRVFVSPLTRVQLGQLRAIGHRLLRELDPSPRATRPTPEAAHGRPGLSRPPAPLADD